MIAAESLCQVRADACRSELASRVLRFDVT